MIQSVVTVSRNAEEVLRKVEEETHRASIEGSKGSEPTNIVGSIRTAQFEYVSAHR